VWVPYHMSIAPLLAELVLAVLDETC
jgi:hypothetical protein